MNTPESVFYGCDIECDASSVGKLLYQYTVYPNNQIAHYYHDFTILTTISFNIIIHLHSSFILYYLHYQSWHSYLGSIIVCPPPSFLKLKYLPPEITLIITSTTQSQVITQHSTSRILCQRSRRPCCPQFPLQPSGERPGSASLPGFVPGI